MVSLDFLLLLIVIYLLLLVFVRISPIPDLSNIPQIWNWLLKIPQIWNWLLITQIWNGSQIPDLSNITHIWSWLQRANTQNMTRNSVCLKQHGKVAAFIMIWFRICRRRTLLSLLGDRSLISSAVAACCPFFLLSSFLVPSRKPQIFKFNLTI